MEKSTVYVSMRDNNDLDCSYAIIDKEIKSVIIIFKDLEVAIYDYEDFKKDSFNNKYLLLKHYSSSSVAYKDFMKLIGKMCKKSSDSKYFNNHIDEDNHMVFYDDEHEEMITNSDYDTRVNDLKDYIYNNKNKFVL